jgi:hypothetical protein
MSKYLDFVTDRVNKQLKQLREESSDNDWKDGMRNNVLP